ncbi:ATPase involved in chromosome partitioning (plasmid) [Cylindrospermum stagnale PCC 7417]|uniref:ATPase involved in chromosome partitioning n=1 Tax=Cylindrospermum stagnale PCC 7417 TaxID=56107 RepID=K9X8B1_9NOST|nr:ParA family partition ATPase [Cylindrospermum stagnale]AFZ28311.1 ATPase involved in chromosome partitioning [Cylindrospermum stagnale PCC 7417]
MKIAILNQKGGSGKTTVSIHLAHALKLKGYRVLLVDTDPQGSSRDWAAARNGEAPFSVMALDRPIIHKELPKLAQGYEYVLIDGAPRVSDLTRSAIMAVDFVLIPIQPSPLDIWAVHEVVELIQEAKIYKPDLSAAFLVNRKVVNSSIAREVSEVLQQYPFPVLNAQISQRVVFAECLNSGSTVLETAPKSAAADEVRAVCEEILADVKEPTNHGRN